MISVWWLLLIIPATSLATVLSMCVFMMFSIPKKLHRLKKEHENLANQPYADYPNHPSLKYPGRA